MKLDTIVYNKIIGRLSWKQVRLLLIFKMDRGIPKILALAKKIKNGFGIYH